MLKKRNIIFMITMIIFVIQLITSVINANNKDKYDDYKTLLNKIENTEKIIEKDIRKKEALESLHVEYKAHLLKEQELMNKNEELKRAIKEKEERIRKEKEEAKKKKQAEAEALKSKSSNSNLSIQKTGNKRLIGVFQATAYDDTPQSQGKWVGKTATGIKPQRGVVAVDPKVIPLGSRLYIESMDGLPSYGYAYAGDTGGAIKGNRIDLFHNTPAECRSFGRRNVRVYILD